MTIEGAWHAVVTGGGRQGEVVAGLTLLDDTRETYAPVRIETVIERGRRSQRVGFWLGPLVLVRFGGPIDGHLWHAVNDLAGSRGFIGGFAPLPIREREIVGLREWLEDHSVEELLHPAPCVVDDRVAFTQGPFVGWTGDVVEVGSGIVVIKVYLLGGPTLVTVPFDAINGILVPASDRGREADGTRRVPTKRRSKRPRNWARSAAA